MNPYRLREHFTLGNYNTTITRAQYEIFFAPTDERVTFTFGGWDGKSYDGESRTSRVLRCSVPGFEAVRFIKVGKSVHYVLEDMERVEKSTGVPHKEVSWLVDVERKIH